MAENQGTVMDNVLAWLHEGYPEGVPPKDYFPLLALLKRSLTEDEVVKAAQSILRSTDADTVTEVEIRTAVAGVIAKEPNPRRSTRSRRGWPPSDGRWRHPCADRCHVSAGASVSGVAPQRMGFGHLDEDQR